MSRATLAALEVVDVGRAWAAFERRRPWMEAGGRLTDVRVVGAAEGATVARVAVGGASGGASGTGPGSSPGTEAGAEGRLVVATSGVAGGEPRRATA